MNTKILFILCILSIIIPMYMSMTCPMNTIVFNSKIKPPNWVFGVIWTILYIFMAISMYLLATTTRTKTNQNWIKFALLITMIGYILNYLYVYMSGCQKDWTNGLYIFIAYLIVIPLQIFLTFYCNPLAGVLLTPLLGWGAYAIIMNAIYVDKYAK